MRRYDFILAGGGAAGLSLAYNLVHSSLRDRPILIVDRDTKERDDRTWSFWTRQPLPFDTIVAHSWNKLRVASGDGVRVVDLGNYRYQTIRGLDYYRFMYGDLASRPNVDRVTGEIDRIDDGDAAARIEVGGECYNGDWIFDSRWPLMDRRPDSAVYEAVQQHFVGTEIDLPTDGVDAVAPTFFDFRTSQDDGIRFFYVLPFTPRRALIEYVTVGAAPPNQCEHERAFRDYLEAVLGIRSYNLLAQERGMSPMTDAPYPRRIGRRIMSIGTRGGRIKPSSGFAFTRIQRDSVAIVQSLIRSGHPFAVPPDSRRYRLYDSLLLGLMARQPETIEPIFRSLFDRNPIERVFQFLDETGSPWDNLKLIATLPPSIFLRALPAAKVWRRGVLGVRGVQR